MSFLQSLFAPETRARGDAAENPSIPLTDVRAFLSLWGGAAAFSGESVNETTAMGVPAIQAAVNVISGTIASLPLHLYRTTGGVAEMAKNDPLYRVVHDVVNADAQTSVQWREYMISRYLLRGRAFSFIERNGAGKVTNLWALNPDQMTVRIEADPKVKGVSQRIYEYRRASGLIDKFKAFEIIDLVWMLDADGFSHRDPINTSRNAIGLAIAAERYASSVFENGGVPPFALETSASSPLALEKADRQTEAKLQNGRASGKKLITIGTGDRLTKLGSDPNENQLTELRRFQIEEVARIFNIPMTFLQDLTNGSYSNTEQLDLQFSKHTIAPILKKFEAELNAKLFSDRNKTNYVEFNLDGLERGDSTRIANYAAGVNAGIYMPDEIRSRENLPPVKGGDRAYRQGALVPLDADGFTTPGKAPAAPEAPVA